MHPLQRQVSLWGRPGVQLSFFTAELRQLRGLPWVRSK